MMSGLLTIPGGRFHWVYDCGSNQKDALTREIAKVVAVGDVDCLFLSHLDSDHVNGIDQLLASVSVREVVLPYLNDIDKFVLAARDASDGTLTGTTIALLANIPAWFRERGVHRITFINPYSDDDGGEGSRPDLPDGSVIDGVHEGEIKAKWYPGTGNSASAPSPQTMSKLDYMTLNLPQNRLLDWILVPFAHRPSDARLAGFKAELMNAFGAVTLDDRFLSSVLVDPSERQKLRYCYDVIWSDHNLVSMALYAGPIARSGWHLQQVISRQNRYPSIYFGKVGWLGTGDMHLDVKVRCKAFLYHYGGLLKLVNVFGLPHHGSYLNFDISLLTSTPNAVQFVAASGPNNYGHPSKVVKQEVRSYGKQFVHVSHHAHCGLKWVHNC
jgi:hypothetical protein